MRHRQSQEKRFSNAEEVKQGLRVTRLDLKEREELGCVEVPGVHVRADLNTLKPKLLDTTTKLFDS